MVVFFFPFKAFGQGGYIATDTSKTVGVTILDGGEKGNARDCQIKDGDKIIRYSAYDLSEYGYKEGPVFVSKEIEFSGTPRRVFLERLFKGKVILYYYRADGIKTFYLQKDSSFFIELPKESAEGKRYNEQLSELTNDCEAVALVTKHVSYNKKSLTSLVSRYNDCVSKPFPHFRYGLNIGYDVSHLNPTSGNPNEKIKYMDFKYDGGFTLGLFIDNPIAGSDFSFHTGIDFSRHGFSSNKILNGNELDFVANISSVEIPLQIRYVYPSDLIRPFANIGILGAYNLRNETMFFETVVVNNLVEIFDAQVSDLISDIHYGYSFGGGVEYKINFRNSLIFELRYTKRIGIEKESIDNSGFKFVTGFTF